MELLENASKGVLVLLSVVGLALSAALFNTYQDDTKRIQELYIAITSQNTKMLLAQQASQYKFDALITTIEHRTKSFEELKDNQNTLVIRVDKLEFLWKLNKVKKLIASDIANPDSSKVMDDGDISRIVNYLR